MVTDGPCSLMGLLEGLWLFSSWPLAESLELCDEHMFSGPLSGSEELPELFH